MTTGKLFASDSLVILLFSHSAGRQLAADIWLWLVDSLMIWRLSVMCLYDPDAYSTNMSLFINVYVELSYISGGAQLLYVRIIYNVIKYSYMRFYKDSSGGFACNMILQNQNPRGFKVQISNLLHRYNNPFAAQL